MRCPVCHGAPGAGPAPLCRPCARSLERLGENSIYAIVEWASARAWRKSRTAADAEVDRLRTSLALAQSVLRAIVDCDDAITAGGVPPLSRAEVAAAARAALGEP